jgi:DNA-directed RNA polymerase subunit RPC12/RpoP
MGRCADCGKRTSGRYCQTCEQARRRTPAEMMALSDDEAIKCPSCNQQSECQYRCEHCGRDLVDVRGDES